ncbi:hypothetical protein ACHAXN_005948 [Cyclotella atomus]
MLGKDDGDGIRSAAQPSLLAKDPIRVLVIGDSLTVDMGSVEVFDPLKNNDVLRWLKNVVPTSKIQPPVFPLERFLHNSNSLYIGEMEAWMVHLGSYYTQGTPDIICVLFGMDDLKNLVPLNIIPRILRNDDTEDGGGGIAHHFR